ncbi:DEAD/DEAH box helicase [Sulfurimonas paralvinellae]|uniref:DEAD-box ATP-dependent RNA helicase RhpA n=1 Tax=Sulfurimonas paralvinellae TaxID=317658 RepID=A0A7M1B706_9BACT|nr:DEAD/DEAH box helicase [Sulfurimonas paralvinellae]QOP45519.1 DEAD/DEAH box helicase [Sulfurimonas paralvinellae]
MTFNSLGLSAPILKAVKEQGYTTPTPIQAKAIPVILEKKDILAGAQTGTGKTAGFTLPLLELLSRKESKKKSHKVRALILTPTRELALQVAENVALYAKHTPFKSAVIFGGVKINPQIAQLRKGVDIVIATPGRLLDHISQKTIDLREIEFLVLDEADRMLDMGFVNDIKKIVNIIPKERQTLLFSATYSAPIKRLSNQFLKSPTLIEVARTNESNAIVEQSIYPVDKSRKRELLTHLINEGKWQQVLVFTRTKHGANKLSGQLEKDGISSAAIHGNKSQNARTKALADFKKGDVRVLVATDIAARGIDIDQLPHVVNFELPNVSEDYVHRIGRTGRAGNKGEAISLVCVDENDFLDGIEKLIKKDIPKVWLKGFKPDPSIKAEPINMGGNRGSRSKPRGNSNGRNANRSRARR